MPVISRNGPCPCGSNKKHKKCCLPVKEIPRHGAAQYTAAERDRATAALLAFSEREHFQKRRRAALDFCFAGLEVLPDHCHAQIQEMSLPQQTFLTYLCLDQQLREDDKPMIFRFLERYRTKLSPGERRFLERIATSSIVICEIVRIDLERGIEVRDMRTGEGVWIKAPTASVPLQVFDVFAGRLIEGVDGRTVINGDAYRFTQTQALLLLQFLVERERKYGAEFEIEPKKFMKLFGAALVNQFWIQATLLPGLYQTFMKNRVNVKPDEVDVEEGEDEEEAIPALTATYEEEWLDAPLPKIGNRTPREMLQDEEARSLAVALLKDLERTAEAAGIDRSEIAPAWEKLGLVRG